MAVKSWGVSAVAARSYSWSSSILGYGYAFFLLGVCFAPLSSCERSSGGAVITVSRGKNVFHLSFPNFISVRIKMRRFMYNSGADFKLRVHLKLMYA